jgi:hypothetical protein
MLHSQPDAGFRRLGFRCCHARGLASSRSRNPTNSGEVEHLHDLPILLGDVRQELSLRHVLADYPARLGQAPDWDQVPAVRKEAGLRREPANQCRRSSVACNELDGA